MQTLRSNNNLVLQYRNTKVVITGTKSQEEVKWKY